MSNIRIATITLTVADDAQDADVLDWLEQHLPNGSGRMVLESSGIQLRDPDEPLRKAVLVSGMSEPIEVSVDDNLVKLSGSDGSIAVELSALVDR